MTGELYINDVDAYTAYGMSLEDGGLARLMTPAPNKQPVVNSNVTADGSYVVAGVGCKESRTVSIPFHIVASDKEDFLAKYAALCAVLDDGTVDIRTRWQPDVVYRFIYIDCNQYEQFINGMAKFTLSLYEPNPQRRI